MAAYLSALLVCMKPLNLLLIFAMVALGIVFGAMGMKEAKASGTGKGLAVAGLVCGIIGTVVCAIMFACVVCAATAIAGALGSLA